MAQEFFIRQGATLPILKVAAVNDGRFDFDTFNEAMQDSVVYFRMVNAANGNIKISKGTCRFKLIDPDACKENYAITYHWNSRDTSEKGKYIGTFTAVFNGNLTSPGKIYPEKDDKLIVPLKEEIIINII